MPKISYNKNITNNKYFWIFAFPVGYLFLLFFSKWVNKYYNTSLKKAEELLKEIEILTKFKSRKKYERRH